MFFINKYFLFYIYIKLYILFFLFSKKYNYNKTYTIYDKENNFPKSLVISNNSILFFSSNPNAII